MKKLIILAAAAICSIAMMAQEGTQNIGLYLGYANPILRESPVPTIKTGISNKLSNKQLMEGFTLGLAYETTFIKGFGMQLAANYTFGGRTGKWTSTIEYPRYKDNVTFHAIEIPVDWQYKFTIAKETYLLLYTGPTLQVGMAYKQHRTTAALDTHTMKIGETKAVSSFYDIDNDADDKKDYSRVNVMWGVGAGFQYKQYFLRGGYDFGIASPYKDGVWNGKFEDGSDWYRKGRFDQWSLKLGIYFWQF